jgi:hypothetical protein
MKDAAAIIAQLVDIRNVGQHKCMRLELHIPPEDAPLVMAAFGWPTMVNPVPVILARFVPPAEREVEAETTNDTSETALPASVKHPVRAPRNELARRAGILSKTPLFHRYIEATTTSCDVTEEMAAEFIRGRCGVQSRAEIIPNSDAGTLFMELDRDFMLWSKRVEYVEVS